MGCDVHVGDARHRRSSQRRAAARHRHRHGRPVRPRADARRRRAVRDDAHARIRGVGFIRAKESDRLGDLCAELRRAGVDATETDDGLVDRARPRRTAARLRDPSRSSPGDGASACSVWCVAGVEIDDPDVVSKSWPGYWAHARGACGERQHGGCRVRRRRHADDARLRAAVPRARRPAGAGWSRRCCAARVATIARCGCVAIATG